MGNSMLSEAAEFIKTRKKTNLAVVIINLAVFLVMELLGSTGDAQFMASHGAMVIPMSNDPAQYYRLFTCMFLHFGMTHLFYNMLMLIFMGDLLEHYVGAVRYLLIYLGGGLIGNIVSAVFGTLRAEAEGRSYLTAAAGASGAIFAVVGALLLIAVQNRNRRIGLDTRRLALMSALTLAGGLSQKGVDNLAHLGGFLGGALLCFLVCRGGKRLKIRRWMP